jgi:predicted DNA-binding WGR domain protein
MTATVLYRIDPAKRMHRFHRLDVQPDLFGQWCLMREWGRIGSTGPGALNPLPYQAAGTGRARQAASCEGAARIWTALI